MLWTNTDAHSLLRMDPMTVCMVVWACVREYVSAEYVCLCDVM